MKNNKSILTPKRKPVVLSTNHLKTTWNEIKPTMVNLLAVTVLFVSVVSMSMVTSGCNWSKISSWFGKPGSESSNSIDGVAFNKLEWRYGDINHSNAKLSDNGPRLGDPSCNGRRMSYSWKTGMQSWGLRVDDASAICSIFIEDTKSGKWIGGKFDWVSTSRNFRDLNHLTSYGSWRNSGTKLPIKGRVAFVVTDKLGKNRTNVIVATVK